MKIVQYKDQKYLMCAHGQTIRIDPECEIVASTLCDAIVHCKNEYYFYTCNRNYIPFTVPENIVKKILQRDPSVIEDIMSTRELYEHEKKLLLRFVKLLL